MKKFGELLVEKGYATEEQVEIALGLKMATREILGRTLLEKNYITFEQFKALVAYQEANPGKRIGDCAVEMGYVTQKQVEEAMEIQNREKTLLGDLMVDLGFITPEQRDEVLALQAKLKAS